uniref:EMI domain-containing protein n=1 Tax=Nothobranchius furzeri TaxID=105023 RepID=A0A8C6PIA8_NOTFU
MHTNIWAHTLTNRLWRVQPTFLASVLAAEHTEWMLCCGQHSLLCGFKSSCLRIHRRNWCPHTVTKTVTCQVQNGTILQRVYQTCRWPQGCSGGSYKTVVRPSYKVVYRTVTSMEWKCCPGFSGTACEEGESGQTESFPTETHSSKVELLCKTHRLRPFLLPCGSLLPLQTHGT